MSIARCIVVTREAVRTRTLASANLVSRRGSKRWRRKYLIVCESFAVSAMHTVAFSIVVKIKAKNAPRIGVLIHCGSPRGKKLVRISMVERDQRYCTSRGFANVAPSSVLLCRVVDRDILETRITGGLRGENRLSIVPQGSFCYVGSIFLGALREWPGRPVRYCWRPATGLRLVGVPNWRSSVSGPSCASRGCARNKLLGKQRPRIV